MENEAYNRAWIFSWVFFFVTIVCSLWQYVCFHLYNQKYHPMAVILDESRQRGTNTIKWNHGVPRSLSKVRTFQTSFCNVETVTKNLTMAQKYSIAKKNLQFLSYHYETSSNCYAYDYLPLPQFQLNWIKIFDFLLLAYIYARVKFLE